MKYPKFSNPTCASIGVEAYYVQTTTLDDLNLKAKELCKECPDFAPCLEWALVHEDQGIWAGTTNQDRNRLRRKHNITFIPINPVDFIRKTRKDDDTSEA